MFLVVEWDTVSVVCHCIQEIVQVLRVEDVPNVRKEGVGQPTNPTPFADKPRQRYRSVGTASS